MTAATTTRDDASLHYIIEFYGILGRDWVSVCAGVFYFQSTDWPTFGTENKTCQTINLWHNTFNGQLVTLWSFSLTTFMTANYDGTLATFTPVDLLIQIWNRTPTQLERNGKIDLGSSHSRIPFSKTKDTRTHTLKSFWKDERVEQWNSPKMVLYTVSTFEISGASNRSEQ